MADVADAAKSAAARGGAERNFTEAGLADAVIARHADCHDPRVKQILTALIRHAHAFVREVRLTEAEWFEGIKFLTATGQKCDALRQEFILLSDVLGISMLVDAINHPTAGRATASTVLGPFFLEGAPDLPAGADIAAKPRGGERARLHGRVRALDGAPIAGALLDIWQAAGDGLYSMQDPEQGLYNLRGKFRTDADGRYDFRCIRPVSYPIPTDGPVGRLLGALGRQQYRPAHVHFMISAPGFESLTTHLFDRKDPLLDSDPVFGVKDSLVVDFRGPNDSGEYEVEYDFVLEPAR